MLKIILLFLLLLLSIIIVHLPWTLLVYEFPLGTSETFLCFMLVNFIKIIPPAGVLTAANFICNHLDVFRREFVTLSQL
jgi:hypothetical protein